MKRLLLILALLCGSAYAVVPVNTCSNIVASATSASCTIATASANHAVVVNFRTGGATGVTVTYSDTIGNSGTAAANCATFGAFGACAGPLAIYYLGYCSGLNGLGQFALSTGASSGSITFTVSSSSSREWEIFVAEYGQDLLSFEQANQGGSPTFNITTSGSNDLVVVQGGDCFGGTWTSAASGFTLEYAITTYGVSDKINVAPGTYNVAMTESGGVAAMQLVSAFGVGTAASTAVRHRSQVY